MMSSARSGRVARSASAAGGESVAICHEATRILSPRQATFAVFAINGAMVGTWVANIPWLQERLGISKTTLGLCLLCGAFGGLLSMPLTGQILHRRSSATLTRVTALAYCLLLPLPLCAPSAAGLAPILFVFRANRGGVGPGGEGGRAAAEEGGGRPGEA